MERTRRWRLISENTIYLYRSLHRLAHSNLQHAPTYSGPRGNRDVAEFIKVSCILYIIKHNPALSCCGEIAIFSDVSATPGWLFTLFLYRDLITVIHSAVWLLMAPSLTLLSPWRTCREHSLCPWWCWWWEGDNNRFYFEKTLGFNPA